MLQHPLVIGVAGFMTVIEGLADKIPWLDSLWDTVHTLIRIPAGAALAAAVFGDSGTAVATAAALLGGSLTATTHRAKSGLQGRWSTLRPGCILEHRAVAGRRRRGDRRRFSLLAEHPLVLLKVLGLLLRC